MTIRPARILRAVALMLVAWITIPAVVMAVTGDAPAALVILPPDGLVDALPEGVALVSVTRFSVTVREGAAGAVDGGLVRRLYALGAPLVLPSGLTGCFAIFARAVG